MVTADRQRAKLIGYLLHLVAGLLFSLAYYVGFVGLGRAGWLLGAAFGVIHGVFAMTALVNVLLPVIHPRMGSSLSSVDSTALLEAPGFLMLNYGRATPVVTLIAHVDLRRDRRRVRVARQVIRGRSQQGGNKASRWIASPNVIEQHAVHRELVGRIGILGDQDLAHVPLRRDQEP